MNRLVLIGLAPLAVALPAAAQTMDRSSMPGMAMPAPATPAAPAGSAAQGLADPHAGHDMAAMPPNGGSTQGPASDPHAGHDMSAMPGMAMPSQGSASPSMPGMPGMAGHDMSGMAQPNIPKTPPPPPPADRAADRFFSPVAMDAARRQLLLDNGAAPQSMVMANLFERQFKSGTDGYRWDGQAWFGGDINRFVLKTEGEGSDDGLETAEVQALYSRAVGPYTDLQVGLRQDFEPYGQTYATLGFETLAPYWIDLEGAAFLSTKGDLLARVEGTYDLRLTQRWILQPRAEFNFAAQDVPESRVGSGLTNAEIGLRLRYEIRREFAPYVGVSWERKTGKTADFARDRGEDVESISFVIGARAFF